MKIPFLNPNRAPASNEYAVLGRAGTIMLVERNTNNPKGANGPISSILLLSDSIPYSFNKYINRTNKIVKPRRFAIPFDFNYSTSQNCIINNTIRFRFK